MTSLSSAMGYMQILSVPPHYHSVHLFDIPNTLVRVLLNHNMSARLFNVQLMTDRQSVLITEALAIAS